MKLIKSKKYLGKTIITLIVFIFVAVIFSSCGENNDVGEQDNDSQAILSFLEGLDTDNDDNDSVDEEITVASPQNTPERSPTANTTSPITGTGETFMFRGAEITIGNEIKWDIFNRRNHELNGETIFAVPTTINNLTDESYMLILAVIQYGSKGVGLPNVGIYFNDNIERIDIRRGATADGYLYFLYDGDGEYSIIFDGIGEEYEFWFSITNGVQSISYKLIENSQEILTVEIDEILTTETDIFDETIIITSGETFIFENVEITIGTDIKWSKVGNQFAETYGRDVFAIPVIINNLTDESYRLSSIRFNIYGADGIRMRDVGSYFRDNDITRVSMRSGATGSGYLFLLYDNDGEYSIEFSRRNEKYEFKFSITHGVQSIQLRKQG